ncbi:MAG: nickel-dependent hydrogenase large subunit, partial [Nitrospirota bacterium]
AYKLPPDLNLLAVAHYLEALDMQAKAAHLSALFGGRMPMTMTSPPGGSTHVPTVDDIANYLFRIKELQNWIDNVYVPDVLAIAPYYLDYAGVGKGHANFLSWGVFEDASFDPKKRLLPRGAIFADSFPKVQDAKPEDVAEHTSHSWYKGAKPLNPSVGETDPEYTGYDPDKKYTWAKAPRLKNKPMEVGALARMLVAYASGQPTAKKLIDNTLAAIGHAGKPQVLLGVVGRIAARALECKMVADSMYQWGLDIVENIKKGKTEVYTPYEIPDKAKGIGLWEAPRGALGHWIDVEGKKIKNYQCVVPTTWNVCPRDDKGVRGPIEEALVGTSVVNSEKPLEVLRVVHSFDPCLACTVHVIHPESNRIMEFKVS